MQIEQFGDIVFLRNGNFSNQRVIYVEGLKHNHISGGQCCNAGHHIEFDGEYI